jgi:hypothetical protein
MLYAYATLIQREQFHKSGSLGRRILFTTLAVRWCMLLREGKLGRDKHEKRPPKSAPLVMQAVSKSQDSKAHAPFKMPSLYFMLEIVCCLIALLSLYLPK